MAHNITHNKFNNRRRWRTRRTVDANSTLCLLASRDSEKPPQVRSTAHWTFLHIFISYQTRLNFIFAIATDSDDPSATAQALLRKNVLQSLVETPKPPEDIPPARLPTKEEKELIKLSISLEHLKMQSQMGTLGVGEQSTLFDNNGSYISTAPSSKVLAPLRSPMGLGHSQSQSMRASGTPSVKRGGVSPPQSRGTTQQSFLPNQRHNNPILISALKKTNTASTGGGRARSPTTPAVNSSTFFGGDNSVLMSSFGGPSLWSIPGERDIYGNPSQVRCWYYYVVFYISCSCLHIFI